MTETPNLEVRVVVDQPMAGAPLTAETRDKAAAISELVRDSFEPSAVTRVIGIFGPWGSGKNSLFVVIVASIDVGLPLQTALILETLRLFATTRAPCAFVILAEEIASLRTAVRTRFVNQLKVDDIEELKGSLIRMADAYLLRLLTPFELSMPTAAELSRALKSLLEPPTEETGRIENGIGRSVERLNPERSARR